MIWDPNSYDEPCPSCGHFLSDIGADKECVCNQCGYEWVSRSADDPVRCPKCKSANWKMAKVSQNVCRKCGYVWKSKTENPKYCPQCKTGSWDKDTFKLKCFRCGHKWMPSEGVDPDSVKTCPSCRSKKWNKLPFLRRCKVCHRRFISQTRGSRCPECSASKSSRSMVRMECGFCGTTWMSEGDDRICPGCGLVIKKGDNSERNVVLWKDSEYRLNYLFKDGIGCVYLWKGNFPENCEYMDSMLDRLSLRYNTVMNRAEDLDYEQFWIRIVDDMHSRRDTYLENTPYLKERLGLDEYDAEILSLHFVGMSPEVIAIRLGVPLRDVRLVFTRIQEAYKKSGIVVNDSVYTEDPTSYYDAN